jgi:putative nucleotidyltransferase with HDIG domain
MERNDMDNEATWNILEKIEDLPTLPSVYFKVNKLLQDEDASIEAVGRIIEIDPAMSTNILRLVNSAFYGARSKSSSVSQAVMILGFQAVKNAIISVSVLDTLSVKTQYRNFSIADYWRHSVSVAVISKHLAQKTRLVSPDDAFIAGLLHDVGKIIMIKYFKEDFEKILEIMEETKCSFVDAEQKAEGIDHILIGAYLARKWQLPENIVQAIAGHHYFITSSKSTGLIECVMVANAMSDFEGNPINPDDYVFEDHIENVIKPLMINTDTWLPQAKAEIETACKFFLEGK